MTEKEKEVKAIKSCYDCDNCVYVGEGGFMCLHTNKIVMDDFMPTDDYKINCKRWEVEE